MYKLLTIVVLLLTTTNAYAAPDCARLNQALIQYGESMVISFAPSMGYSVKEVRWAIKYCSKK